LPDDSAKSVADTSVIQNTNNKPSYELDEDMQESKSLKGKSDKGKAKMLVFILLGTLFFIMIVYVASSSGGEKEVRK